MGYDQNKPPTLEQRVEALEEKVAALEDNTQRNNQNLCKTLEKLACVLLDARNQGCELPPGCESVLTITSKD